MKRSAGAGALSLVVMLTSGCALGLASTVLGEISEDIDNSRPNFSDPFSNSEDGSISVLDLRVGDCINENETPQYVERQTASTVANNAVSAGSDDREEIYEVELVWCDLPHDFEVYHEFELNGVDYDSDEVFELAEAGCLEAVEPFVGIDYESSEYGFAYYMPTQEGWEIDDDRGVTCLVGSLDGQISGSLEGIRR